MTREISQYWPIKNSGSLLIVGFYGYSNMQILLFFKSCIRAYSVCWEQMGPYGSASHTCMAHHNILTGARCVNGCCMTVLSLDEMVWSILFDRRSGMGSRQYGDHWASDYVGKNEVNITLSLLWKRIGEVEDARESLSICSLQLATFKIAPRLTLQFQLPAQVQSHR